jgi:beta-lactamase class D
MPVTGSREMVSALRAAGGRVVSLFNYGNVDVSGNPGQGDGLTQAWLTSSLKISALEQVAFMTALFQSFLSISFNHVTDTIE